MCVCPHVMLRTRPMACFLLAPWHASYSPHAIRFPAFYSALAIPYPCFLLAPCHSFPCFLLAACDTLSLLPTRPMPHGYPASQFLSLSCFLIAPCHTFALLADRPMSSLLASLAHGDPTRFMATTTPSTTPQPLSSLPVSQASRSLQRSEDIGNR